MISGRWVAIIVVAFAVICGGVALAVLGGDGRNATTMGSVGGGGDLTGVAATDTASPASDAGTTLLDPAKQEPILDLFTAKDPFAPLGGFSPEPTPTPTPTETVSPDEPLSADVTIGGIPDTVVAGDETPLDDPAFYVADVTSSGVTFELIDGQTFDDGSSSVEVAEGQEVVVTTADTGESFRISVVSLNYGDDDGGDDDGGGGGGGDDGHTVELRSINTQNGVDTATIAVDGVTYADLEVGDQVDTDWGQIKVLAIDPGAQTVTILHGDDTLVLRVGQSIEK
jgi:hypothetical protein